MNRYPPVLIACAATAALAGCATPGTGATGAASAVMANDGSVEFRVRKAGLFGRREVVVIRPGEPGYEEVKGTVESIAPPGGRKPVLRWTIGEPVYLP